MSKPGLATRTTAAILLTRVIDDGRSLDGLLDTRHGPRQFSELSQADKGLARAIVTVALRRRGEIDYALGKLLDRKLPSKARHLVHTLHVAAAQILFLDIPDSAAVDLAVTALRNDKRSTRFSGLANAILRRLSREKAELFANRVEKDLAMLNMAPWLSKRVKKDYGRDRMAEIAKAHMIEPLIDITVKDNAEEWATKLEGQHLFGNSIRISRDGNIETWPEFESGEWWVQDAAASLPAQLFGDVKGKTVLDLCAAPGGKTAQLAAQGARVTALEASEPRLKRLQENLDRLQLSVTCHLGDMMEWQSDNQFDLVLLDAPCSSTGTIRRHPDVQWNKSPQIIAELAQLQFDMIVRAAGFVKPGGTLIFSNCSLDRAEGEDVYAQVLKADLGLVPNPISADECFDLDEIVNRQGAIRTLPSHLQSVGAETGSARLSGLDGFFCARFTRST
ncbi:MAG: RsmB/NOP family class I SAM-dependent RNA methyltransferase [Rhizobiaceae bacterium]